MNKSFRHPASFKDPAGFIFWENGCCYRQVNTSYAEQYRLLMQSGLYDELVKDGMLLPHVEQPAHSGPAGDALRVLLPQQLSFTSYPGEWSFSMLRDAALLTLDLHVRALDKGMMLKDASAWNIQFFGGKPLLIDSLSFDLYDEATPWVAYSQFCRHFLFPLLVYCHSTREVLKWFTVYPDGIPADLTADLLPASSKWKMGTYLHVHLQKKMERKYHGADQPKVTFSKQKMLRLVWHLKSMISSLKPVAGKSQWSDYYDNTILGNNYLVEKHKAFVGMLDRLELRTAVDLGCNNGYFSRLMADKGLEVIAADADQLAIDQLYSYVKEHGIRNIHPVVSDLSNPGPASGWLNKEHESFLQRIISDLTLALALVHHLYFTFNIPLKGIFEMLAGTCRSWCLVEFVDLVDERAKLISHGKAALIEGYSKEEFESAAATYFEIVEQRSLEQGRRVLYLLKKTLA